jgi:hypothetical protein
VLISSGREHPVIFNTLRCTTGIENIPIDYNGPAIESIWFQHLLYQRWLMTATALTSSG